MGYLDFHCDTLMLAYEKKMEEIGKFPEASIDIERLRRGGVDAQFFAAFVPPRESGDWWERCFSGDGDGEEEPFWMEEAYIRALKGILGNTQEKYGKEMRLVKTASQMGKAKREGKLAAFFTLEDGRSLNGSMEKLEAYYRELGVSLITLTWNYENCFGFPNSRKREIMERGLKPFGKEAVEYMNSLGVIVDVSHLSDGGFWDVVRISKKPFVASHSNCRALSPHPRNLTDEMLRALAEKGGVTGLNFCSAFLGQDTESRDSRLEDMIAQVRHMVQVGGINCVAIGTDFDGIQSRLEVGDPTRMELLFEGLRKAGFSADMVEQMAWKNGERVLYDITG